MPPRTREGLAHARVGQEWMKAHPMRPGDALVRLVRTVKTATRLDKCPRTPARPGAGVLGGAADTRHMQMAPAWELSGRGRVDSEQ